MSNTRILLREEIALNNKKMQLSEHSLMMIQNSSYVKNVLGINVPLNETYSLSLRKQIINEQLLYEAFLDSVKTFLKDKYDDIADTVKNVYGVMILIKDVITNPKKLQSAIFLAKKNLNKSLKNLTTKITDFLNKVKITNITTYLKGFLDKVRNIIIKLVSYEGWKGFILVSGISLLLSYAVKTYIDPILVNTSKFFNEEFIKMLESKMNLFKQLATLIPSVNDIKQVFDWFNTIGATAELITSVFTPISDKIKFGDELTQKINTRTQ
jgi:hypothetical protein